MAETKTELDLQDEIITTLRDMLATGQDIDIIEMAVSLDLDSSMTKVKNFLLAGTGTTKQDWARALKTSAVVRDIGFYPKNAVDLVDKWISTNKITVNYQKAMKRTTLPMIDGKPIPAESRKDKHVDAIARIKENVEINTETLKLNLRVKVAEMGLRFTDQQVSDAVSKWFESALSERVEEVYLHVACDGGTKSVDKVAAWDAVASQFCMRDHDAKFVIAVLKKFIWQVKRKMLGLPITNHLMPVITGPQGVGKSTFVRDVLLMPIDELVSNTDFAMIEDNRIMDLWRNYALFLDEMGYAGKANIDNVKNKITAPYVTGRPMRTNDNVQYKQNATFIGCSNKELDQLIRDETGNRRFVSLRFSSAPDWSKLNGIDARMLWTSVDERGDDPTSEIASELREAQALIRERSVVEQWLEQVQIPKAYEGKKRQSKDLYPEFKQWSEEFTSGRVLDVAMFGKEFTRLINSGQIADWSQAKLNGRTVYIYK
jgi:predicted P-loop ATPase